MITKIGVAMGVLGFLFLLPVALGDFAGVGTAQAVSIPEPSTLTLLMAGLGALVWRARRKR